uniref:Tetraspanin 32 n=1 Tax=Equus asinus asinus TaxID=83772 RepID=A0A8C4KQM2_EQUAS
MRPRSRVRVAKCQMLVTSFFVLLLGLAVASMAALTYFGAHFAVLGHASSERTSYKAMHRWAFYVGISLAGLLTLGAVLTATATVREAGGLMAVVSSLCPSPLGPPGGLQPGSS